MEGKQMGRRPLADLTALQMHLRGHSREQVANALGVSQGHLSQLLLGNKRFAALGEDALRRCAHYVGIPVVTCMLLAGKLKVADFYDPVEDAERQCDAALLAVAQSNVAQECQVGIDDLNPLPGLVKRFIVHLYEEAVGVELIPRRLSQEAIKDAAQLHVPFEVRMPRSR